MYARFRRKKNITIISTKKKEIKTIKIFYEGNIDQLIEKVIEQIGSDQVIKNPLHSETDILEALFPPSSQPTNLKELLTGRYFTTNIDLDYHPSDFTAINITQKSQEPAVYIISCDEVVKDFPAQGKKTVYYDKMPISVTPYFHNNIVPLNKNSK